MMILCILFAVLTGLTYTASILVQALPLHYAALRGEGLSTSMSTVLMVLYVVLNAGSVIPLLCSTHNGPVAVAVPVMLASQLMSNMIVQAIAGSLYYSKSMRVGTYVLAVAAVQLINVGPTDPTEKVSSLELLSAPLSIGWIGCMGAMMVAGASVLPALKGASKDSMPKLLAYTAIISNAAALNNSLAKVVTDVAGLALLVCSVLYVLMGFTSTLASAYGNASLNNASSVPMFTCMQVVVNGLTGVFVWGDWSRVVDKLAYTGVYALMLMGIYLSSSVELNLIGTYLSKHVSLETNGDPCEGLLDAMEQEQGVEDALRKFLKLGLEQKSVRAEEISELCGSLAGVLEKSDGVKPLVGTIARWRDTDCQLLHDFAKRDPVTSKSFDYIAMKD